MAYAAIIGAIISAYGASEANSALGKGQSSIGQLAQATPTTFQGPGGFGIQGTSGSLNMGSLGLNQQALLQLMEQQGGNLMSGGLFNSATLQNALGQNDIAGALGQSNAAFGQQAGNTAFGGLQGLFGQQAGLGQQFGNLTAQGPQDFSGGLQNSLFGQGFANQQAAGDQSGLFNQFLGTQRNAAAGQNNAFFNKLQDKQFAQGRLGSTGGAEQSGAFFDALNQQDLGFQNNAFGLANQQQNFLANLGSQQIGQGQGLLGQNLGQFNQQAQLANMFNQGAAGIEGQQFGQNLGALQQNQSAGAQRLQNAMGLFGLGTDTFANQFGLGLQSQGQITDINQMFSNLFLGQQNAMANNVAATGQHASALGSGAANQGGLLGGLFSGIGSQIGGG